MVKIFYKKKGEQDQIRCVNATMSYFLWNFMPNKNFPSLRFFDCRYLKPRFISTIKQVSSTLSKSYNQLSTLHTLRSPYNNKIRCESRWQTSTKHRNHMKAIKILFWTVFVSLNLKQLIIWDGLIWAVNFFIVFDMLFTPPQLHIKNIISAVL